ncbi:MAG: hypothetical protein ABIP53_09000, partial [Candidatus Limnocylindrales bacterium]
IERTFASARIVLLEAPGYRKSTAAAAKGRALDVPIIRVVLRTRQDAHGLVASVAVVARWTRSDTCDLRRR